MFYFEQVKEVPSFRNDRAPGRGRAWYPEDGKPVSAEGDPG